MPETVFFLCPFPHPQDGAPIIHLNGWTDMQRPTSPPQAIFEGIKSGIPSILGFDFINTLLGKGDPKDFRVQ
jgi:hypothetical protein